MLIPRYWAEAKLRHKESGRQLTLQRWGWSSTSEQEAQALADVRVRQAMDEAIARWGQPVKLKREPKVAYNGADGVPVREEIVEERVEGVVTRNGYGALCLNVADVMFIDIDEEYVVQLPPGSGMRTARWSLLVAVVSAAFAPGSVAWSFFGVFLLAWFSLFWGWKTWHVASVARRGGTVGLARQAIAAQLALHPAGCWRLYQTPRGARILAMHALFDPKQPQVQALMQAMHADPVYAAMCRAQDSFRARVSPKPWRIPGLERMRGPVWPVPPEALARRMTWVAGYDARKDGFASCAFIEQAGAGAAVDKATTIAQWHDGMAQATSGKPLA